MRTVKSKVKTILSVMYRSVIVPTVKYRTVHIQTNCTVTTHDRMVFIYYMVTGSTYDSKVLLQVCM